MVDVLQTGIERLASNPELARHWQRCGLLCNQASMTADFVPAWQIVQRLAKLSCLFSPQHGFEATVQDNMIESPHAIHRPTGLPIYSLYSESRQPTAEMLEPLDTLVVDLQIIGCRVYTFKYTIAALLRAAQAYDKRIVVLDRPNPLGGVVVEGRVLDADVRSFVGEFPIPIRHGLTVAEIAQLFNRDIGANLEVITMNNWQPEQLWSDLQNRPWILTSPNMPTCETAIIFAGTVLFEGTNISEGRGTCLPFQFIGAPFLDGDELIDRCQGIYPQMAGVYLRPTEFMPTNQKWQGQICRGLQIHLTDHHQVRPYPLGLALLRASIEQDDSFCWRQPPYEYEYQKLPINLLVGANNADTVFSEKKFSIDDPFWHEGLVAYCQQVQSILLYPRSMNPSIPASGNR